MFNLPPMCALTFHLKKCIMEMSLSPGLSLILARVLENSLRLSCAIFFLPEIHVNFFPNFSYIYQQKNATNTLRFSIHSDQHRKENQLILGFFPWCPLLPQIRQAHRHTHPSTLTSLNRSCQIFTAHCSPQMVRTDKFKPKQIYKGKCKNQEMVD